MRPVQPIAALILGTLAILFCRAQAPTATATGTVLHANANLVLVDVVVTERDKPVHGLDKSRFHVFEDKREQAITSFDDHRPPEAGAAGSMPHMKRAVLPANTYTNVPAYPEAGAVNVLLLDALNTPLSDQKNVRLKMIDYMAKIKPGTSLAIFGLSSQLRMIAGFSTDLAALSKALKSPRTTEQQSTLRDSEKLAQEAGVTPISAKITVRPAVFSCGLARRAMWQSGSIAR